MLSKRLLDGSGEETYQDDAERAGSYLTLT
jgi:hypothetical protein